MKLSILMLVLVATLAAAHAGDIHDAARIGDLDRVRALVAAAPDSVNSRDRGTTPLHEAARAGHLAIVQFLVEHGANPNTNDVSAATPLRLAIGYRRTNVVAYLREHGALEKLQPPAQKTARVEPTPPKTEYVIRTPPPVATAPTPSAARPVAPAANTPVAPAAPAPAPSTNAGPSQHDLLPVVYPIHEAARVGDVEQIKFIFKSFPDLIESTDEKGQTPLHVAVASNKIAAAQALIGLHAKVNARSDTRHTPLHLAARAGNTQMAALLLTNRADVNARDNFDNTPLLAATQPSDRDDLLGLDERSARVQFRSPQHRAAAAALQQEQLNMVRLLVSNGADVNARNRAGVTALNQSMLTLNEALLDVLLRAGADPNVPDPVTHATPLHVAAGSGLTNVVALLLNSRADVNALDGRGETALGHAYHGGHLGAAALLKNRGGTIGPERTLSRLEQNLADYFRQTDAALQRASAGEKAQIIIGMSPSKADLEKMFPSHAAAAWRVVEEMRRQLKQSFQNGVLDADQGKAIWRLRTDRPTAQTRDWLERGWLNRELPLYSLVVDRVGATSRPGDDYCFVNQHWVLLPPLRPIATVAQAQR